MKFSDIPKYTRHSSYMVHVDLTYLPAQVTKFVRDYNLDMRPDFQRAHVWSPAQRSAFVEHMLRGGRSGLAIYINCPNFHTLGDDMYAVLIDGKQRLDAALGFLNNEVTVFGGHYYKDFTDIPRFYARFEWHVNDLATREEELKWYLDMNVGGVVHSDEEIDKVRALLHTGTPYVRPSKEELAKAARLDRPIFKKALQEANDEQERDEGLRQAPQPPTKTKRKTRLT